MRCVPLILVWAFLGLAIGEEDALPKYRVKYENSDIPLSVAEDFVQLQSIDGSFEIVNIDRGYDREKYLCHLPPSNISAFSDQHRDESIPSGAKNATQEEIIHTAVELINESFSKSHCLYAIGLNGGYWTFAYCFMDKVIQFHENKKLFLETQEHKPENPDFIFVLGRFKGAPKKEVKIKNQAEGLDTTLNESDFSLDEDVVDQLSDTGSALQYSSKQYIQHTLSDGGICDLTQEPRSIDVLYKCDPNRMSVPEILDVQEPKTCTYQVIIHVPKLCQIEEFKPKDVEEQVVDIVCKAVDIKSTESAEKELQLEDFYNYHEKYKQRDLFLASKDFKINLADYHLGPLGSGFYLAQPKLVTDMEMNGPRWTDKNLLVYSGELGTPSDMLEKVGQTFNTVLERKIPSPVFISDSVVSPLSWSDSFIVWYELFDFYGNLIYYVRVFRDGKDKAKRLDFQIIDVETMIDQDGDLVEMPKFEAPNYQYNFELFSRPLPVSTDSDGVADTVTVFETRTEGGSWPSTTSDGDHAKKEIIDKITEELRLHDEENLNMFLEFLNTPDVVLEEDPIDLIHDEL